MSATDQQMTKQSTESTRQVDWLQSDEERVWRALQFMTMHLDTALAQQLAADSNVSYPDYSVLVSLTDSEDGRMRIFELGEVLGWEKSRLSHHLSRMVKRGLVDKEPCGTDRRGAFIVITDTGRRELALAAPGHVAKVRELFINQLSAEQLQTIGAAADAVLTALKEQP